MSQQKALFLQSAQNGEWVVGTKSIQQPGPGEILVKVHAAGLNSLDWKIRAYGFMVETFPVVMGAEAAGVVEQVSEDVQNIKKGDRV